MTWTTIKLSDLATVSSGGGAPQDVNAFGVEGIPFVRAGSLIKLLEGLPENRLELLQPDVASAHRLKLFPAGTVLFAKSGMSATKGHIYQLKKAAYVVNHLAALTPHSKSDSNYLRHVLRFKSPTCLIKDEAYPSIRLGDIEDMEVPAPKADTERERIAAVLDQADELRRKRRCAFERLNQLGQAIFHEMFGDPVANSRNWPRKKIKDIGRVITGNTPSRKISENYGKGIEWIKSDNINNPSYYLTVAQERLSDRGMSIARVSSPGSILVTCIAGSPDCIGNAAMSDRAVAFNQQINAIVPSGINEHYLYAVIRFGKRLVQEASTGGMKGMVSKSRFEEIEIPIPPEQKQKDFAKRIVALEEAMASQSLCLAASNRLFNSLQDRAFRGDL